MTSMSRRRWSDADRYFGPITYAFSADGYRPFAVMASSVGEDVEGASLRFSAFGHTVILPLPRWLPPPHREKVQAKYLSEEAIKRRGRDWYWDIHRREYGFSLSDGFLIVNYGRQTMDSSTEQSWGWLLPWTQWRHVRHSLYGLRGEHVATLPDTGKSYLGDPGRWDRERAIKDATPTVSFNFLDFDGEEIAVTTKIEEREWRLGTGWFCWLSWFCAPRVERSLDLRFSSEVGPRKGSWKGGTIGHAIRMRAGELHEAAFRRYCDENDLTFVGPSAA